MDRQPPPFFKRGPSPLARFTFFALLSVVLMFIDVRKNYLDVFRQGVSVVINPLQRIANLPAVGYARVSEFFVAQALLQNENTRLRQQQMLHAAQTQSHLALQAENNHLRKLLDTRQRSPEPLVPAEILYAGRDPFTQRITVDKGLTHDIRPGQPVVDDQGVIGQVTRVNSMNSEITLLTDKDQAIPVEVVRNGLRAIAFGQGQDGSLELAFVPINTDVQPGDTLVTSGIDGIYPPGLPVAVVSKVERNAALAFAKISCTPSGGTSHHKQVLIIAGARPQVTEAPPAPAPSPAEPAPKGKPPSGT